MPRLGQPLAHGQLVLGVAQRVPARPDRRPGLLHGGDQRAGGTCSWSNVDHVAAGRERQQVVGRPVVTEHGARGDLGGALVGRRRPAPGSRCPAPPRPRRSSGPAGPPPTMPDRRAPPMPSVPLHCSRSPAVAYEVARHGPPASHRQAARAGPRQAAQPLPGQATQAAPLTPAPLRPGRSPPAAPAARPCRAAGTARTRPAAAGPAPPGRRRRRPPSGPAPARARCRSASR